jgi:hypothetical protein
MNGATLVHDISGSYDAFMRLRVSEPFSIFDSKLLYDKQPFLWDDMEVSGSDTTSVYNSNQASVTLSVSSNVAGMRVRQTYQRFAYQPGKSQLIMMTGIIGSNEPGIVRRIGCFDQKCGLFFQSGSNEYAVVKRNFVNGRAEDMVIGQKDWNKNKLDSQDLIQLDLTRANIFYFNYEWLGVGDIFCGVALGGKFVPLHQFYNANNIQMVSMSYPNLPLRYEIENNGTGKRASVTCICGTVLSEGGQQGAGYLFTIDRGITPLSINTSGFMYPLISLRIQSGRENVNVFLESTDIVCTTNNTLFRWAIYLNPTFSAPITYTPRAFSSIEYNNTTTVSRYVTGGTEILSGYGAGSKSTSLTTDIAAKFSLGFSIAGVSDVMVLAIQRLVNQTDSFYGSLTVRECV